MLISIDEPERHWRGADFRKPLLMIALAEDDFGKHLHYFAADV